MSVPDDNLPDPFDSDRGEIDEVVLNVLLAEGLDLPTALEAARRVPAEGGSSRQPGCLWIILVIGPLFQLLRLLA